MCFQYRVDAPCGVVKGRAVDAPGQRRPPDHSRFLVHADDAASLSGIRDPLGRRAAAPPMTRLDAGNGFSGVVNPRRPSMRRRRPRLWRRRTSRGARNERERELNATRAGTAAAATRADGIAGGAGGNRARHGATRGLAAMYSLKAASCSANSAVAAVKFPPASPAAVLRVVIIEESSSL